MRAPPAEYNSALPAPAEYSLALHEADYKSALLDFDVDVEGGGCGGGAVVGYA